MQSQDNNLTPSQKEDRDYFADQYEEMTDPIKQEARKRKKEIEENIKNEIMDYGL